MTTIPTDVLVLHRPTAYLTPRGQAVRATYRLLSTLRELPADDRADVLELLALELDGHGLADVMLEALTADPDGE